jgi:hypothetical protein
VSSGIEAVTGEGNEIKYFDLTPFIGLFRAGQMNSIAVMLQNTWQSDWDNVAFDVSFKAIAQIAETAPQFQTISYSAGANSVMLRMTGPANSSWILESTDALGSGWRTVQTISFDANGNGTVSDNGQNGRPLPSAISSRFYRLRSI